MADSWVEKTIQLKANTVQEISSDFGKLMNTFIVRNLSQYHVYGSLKQTLSTGDYEIQVQPGDYGIIVRPYEFQKVYLLTTSDITVTVYLVWTQNPMMLLPNMTKPVESTNVDVVKTVGLKASELNLDAEKDLQVDVKTLPSLPAGTNNIGKVDVNSQPDVNLAGVTAQKVSAAAAGDVTVKASAGKVYAVRAEVANVTLKDGTTERWYIPSGSKDEFNQPITHGTSIVLNFSAAGDAWILYL